MRQLSHLKLLNLQAQLWVGCIPPAILVWGLSDSHPVCQVQGHQSTPPLRTITFTGPRTSLAEFHFGMALPIW